MFKKRGEAVFASLMLLAVSSPVLAQIGARPARPKVQRPDGPVWDVLRKHCIDCHGIDEEILCRARDIYRCLGSGSRLREPSAV